MLRGVHQAYILTPHEYCTVLPTLAINAAPGRKLHVGPSVQSCRSTLISGTIGEIIERAALKVKGHTQRAALKVKGANSSDISALSITALLSYVRYTLLGCAY